MKKYPFVKQLDLKDCGVASLSMIIQYYGGYISKAKLLDMTNTDKNGTTGYDLVKCAKEVGFDSCGVSCDIEKLKDLTLPVVAHTLLNNKYKHFLVIYEVNYKKNYVLLADPASKIFKMNLDEFKKIYLGVVFIFKPIKVIPKECKNSDFFLTYIKQNKIYIISIILFSLLITLINFIGLGIIKLILDFKYDLKSLFIIGLIVQILKILIIYMRNNILINFTNKMDFKLTMDTFFNVISLPYSYFRNKTTGEISSRIHDISIIKNNFTDILITIFLDSFLAISTGIFLFIISPKLFLIILIFILFYLILLLLFKNIISSGIKKMKIKKSEVDSYIVESVSGFESIKGNNLEEQIINKFKDKLNDYISFSNKFEKNYNIQLSLKQFINDICFLLVITIGITLVMNNKITLGSFLVFESLLSYFLEPIKSIVNVDYKIKDLKNLIERIDELNYYENKNIKYYSHVKNIEFQNLNYTPNNIDLVLKNISFKIKEKDKIMLIGENGSGKSTILKIIKGYYDNKDLLVNGKNNNIKNKVAYISQNEYLFTDTLYNNIIMNRNIKIDKFKQISKLVGIDKLVDKQIGYNRLIEENGFNISGGEKQRIILARSLLTNFDVLIIDEGMSEIDVSSERKILKKILKLYKNKIIIFVSHRNDNLDLFNKLIILNDNVEIIEK